MSSFMPGLALAVLQLTIICLEVSPTAGAIPPQNTSTTCVEVLRVDSSARIEYNSNSPGDRCAWIIRFKDADEIRFKLEDTGRVKGKDEVVNVAAVQKHRFFADITSRNLGHRNTTVHLRGSIAIVVFVAGKEEDGTGLVLNIEKVSELSGQKVSNSSADSITTGSGDVSHPASAGANYTNNELSLFLFVPPPVDSSCTKECLSLEYNLTGMEAHCYDVVEFYDFNSDHDSHQWDYQKMLCSTTHNYSLKVDSFALVVFTSDSSVTNSGFKIKYHPTSNFSSTTETPPGSSTFIPTTTTTTPIG